MSSDAVGIEAHRVAILGEGTVPIALAAQCRRQIRVRRDVVGIGIQSLALLGDRLIPIALASQG